MTTDPTPTPTRFPCEYCHEGHTGDIGGSYDRSACAARSLSKQITELRKELAKDNLAPWQREANKKLLQDLLRQYEAACYVGD